MSKSRRSAFTLVEVLATLVLVAIVLPAAMRGISLALAIGSDTARRTEAIQLAESKLSELIATGEWQQDAELSGDFTETPSGDTLESTAFTWTATAEDWLDSTVKELTVRVMWEWRTHQKEVKLTTIVYTEEQE